ncbi:MAG: FKBP-type peptidyl-prolyl cis-trans isomerase [Bacteroidales bacterium]|nr:FKBP-type peptidyl-prolyl cis-trans isomerase [Bacteroidales bacterium]
MKNNKIFFCGFFLMFVFLFSCNQKQRYRTDEEVAQFKEPLIKINKYLVKKDAQVISDYVKRHKWDMKISKTGLWYMIYDKGNGRKAEEGNIVTLKYTVNLLDGTLCYSSDSLGDKQFKAGHGDVEPGLEEGILLMREGDMAKFILPPHLAHGLVGDDKKIPRRATIVYDVQLVKISN